MGVKVFSILLILLMAGSAVMMLAGGLRGPSGGQPKPVPVPSSGSGIVLDTGSRLFPNIPIPAIGPSNARLQVYIFYSLFCPHCANEIHNNLEYYVSLAKEGTARVYFVDYPQAGAQYLHAGLRCLAKDNGPFLDVMQRIYTIIRDEGRLPTMDDFKKIVGELGYNVSESCINDQLPLIANIATISYRQYQITGTPTIIVYDSQSDKAFKVIGEQSRDRLEKFINDVLEGKAG